MRSICKKGSTTLVAVLALCALTAASASAAQWYVGGKAMTGSEKLAETVKVEEAVKLVSKGADMTYKCTGVTLSKGELVAQNTAKLTLGMTGCETTVPKTGCEIESTMPGFASEATLTKGTSEDTALLTGGGTKKNVWSLTFDERESCGLLFTWDFSGSVSLSLPTGQTEATEQTASFLGEKESPENLIMHEGGTSAGATVVTGKLKIKLASGKAWSFH